MTIFGHFGILWVISGNFGHFKTILRTCPFLASFIKGENKTDKTFYFNNGSLFEFKTYDTPQDAKSGKRDFLFINEANGVPYEIYQELEVRTKKQVYLDYNPIHQHKSLHVATVDNLAPFCSLPDL